MPLNDILAPVEISDYFFVYLTMTIFFLVGGSFCIVKYFYNKKKKGVRYYLKILENCDFRDAKKTALQFSYYGKSIFTDELTQPKFLALEEKLKKYKYIQNITAMPKELEDEIKKLLKEKRDNDA